MTFLDHLASGEAWDLTKLDDAGHSDVWGQVRIEDYAPYLQFSAALWQARADQAGSLTIGSLTGIDRPVPGLSVCETKFIFSTYVRPGQPFPGLDAYNQAYQGFQTNCSADDLDAYYDFRGDMNLKPNTPESNGMIWFSQTMAFACASTTKAAASSGVTDADCQKYYAAPFKTRWDADRAGLAAELLHQPQLRPQVMDQGGTELTMITSATLQDGYRFGDRGAWRFRIGDPTVDHNGNKDVSARTGTAGALVDGWPQYWADPDFGLTKLYPGDGAKDTIKTLLQIAVDRHTNWYATGYDDGGRLPLRGGAWSPFVASSYEMSKSDLFASGYTIQSSDPMKQWMYIFRVKKEHLYNTDRLANEPSGVLDWDHFWLDERSFGTDGLAKDERAWDRLGEPLEDEYETILYLHRIPRGDSGESDTATPPHL